MHFGCLRRKLKWGTRETNQAGGLRRNCQTNSSGSRCLAHIFSKPNLIVLHITPPNFLASLLHTAMQRQHEIHLSESVPRVSNYIIYSFNDRAVKVLIKKVMHRNFTAKTIHNLVSNFARRARA